MTDKEWRMAQNFSKLPEALQIKMLDNLDGAIMALDMLQGMMPQAARDASRKSGKPKGVTPCGANRQRSACRKS